MVSAYLWVRKAAVMPGDKRGRAPRQLVLYPQTAFSPSAVGNGGLYIGTICCCHFRPNGRQQRQRLPLWRRRSGAWPCQALGDIAAEIREWRDTGLVVLGGAVKPPSFYAPLALMCTHAGGLLKATKQPVDAIIRASLAMYWHYKLYALYRPPRLIMSAIFLFFSVFFPSLLVKVRPRLSKNAG